MTPKPQSVCKCGQRSNQHYELTGWCYVCPCEKFEPVAEPAEPSVSPVTKRMMVKPYGGEVHEECPDCRGVCSEYKSAEPTAELCDKPQIPGPADIPCVLDKGHYGFCQPDYEHRRKVAAPQPVAGPYANWKPGDAVPSPAGKYAPAQPVAGEGPQPEEGIDFACGCFIRYWVQDGVIRSGLACCATHEKPNQTLANLLKHRQIEFTHKAGLVEIGNCSCKTPIMRKWSFGQWSSWIHNDPLKANYQKHSCSERGASPHSSTVPTANPILGSTRYAE